MTWIKRALNTNPLLAVDICGSVCDCVYPVAVVQTALAPRVIFPLISTVHTTTAAEFLTVQRFDVTLRIITNAVVLNSFERVAIPFVGPVLLAGKIFNSVFAEQVSQYGGLPVVALSYTYENLYSLER